MSIQTTAAPDAFRITVGDTSRLWVDAAGNIVTRKIQIHNDANEPVGDIAAHNSTEMSINAAKLNVSGELKLNGARVLTEGDVRQGPQGVPGANGKDGPSGTPGATGPAGLAGPAGVDGKNGLPGEPGQMGPMGPAGSTGPEGPMGPKGANAVFPSQWDQNLAINGKLYANSGVWARQDAPFSIFTNETNRLNIDPQGNMEVTGKLSVNGKQVLKEGDIQPTTSIPDQLNQNLQINGKFKVQGNSDPSNWMQVDNKDGSSLLFGADQSRRGIMGSGTRPVSIYTDGKQQLSVNGTGTTVEALNAKNDVNVGRNVVMEGNNSWVLHTPDNTSDNDQAFHIAHKKGDNWDWDNQFQFKPNGTLHVNALRLGNKFRMSGVGDAHGNDSWLRLFDVGGGGYYGGLAAGSLWSLSGGLSGSDERIKKNIESIPAQDMEDIDKLDAKQYELRSDATNKRQYGFVAQEVEKVYPHLVSDGPNNVKSLNYNGIIPIVVGNVQAMRKQLQTIQQFLRTSKTGEKQLCIDDVCVTKEHLKKLLL